MLSEKAYLGENRVTGYDSSIEGHIETLRGGHVISTFQPHTRGIIDMENSYLLVICNKRSIYR